MSIVQGFNAATVDPNDRPNYAPIPEGTYTAVITETAERQIKSGKGQSLSLELTIMGGEFAGRKLWENLNLVNESDKAVKIARATLSEICRAVGVMTPQTAQQLANIPMSIEVKIQRRKDNGELQNVVSKYSPRGVSAAPAFQPQQQQQQIGQMPPYHAPSPGAQQQPQQQQQPVYAQPAAGSPAPWQR